MGVPGLEKAEVEWGEHMAMRERRSSSHWDVSEAGAGGSMLTRVLQGPVNTAMDPCRKSKYKYQHRTLVSSQFYTSPDNCSSIWELTMVHLQTLAFPYRILFSFSGPSLTLSVGSFTYNFYDNTLQLLMIPT